MRKVIFFDIDGTLVHHNAGKKSIPTSVIQQMNRLRKAGYLLFLASGRPYTFIGSAISNYLFDGYILCNGAHVEYQDKFLFHKPMVHSEMRSLLEKLKTVGCEYIIETKRESYLNPQYKGLHNFFISCDINESLLLHDFNEEVVSQGALKLEVSAQGRIRDEVESYIKGKFNYDCHGTENAFEIYSSEVTKAVGVKKVLEHFKIDTRNSYAFGDGLNDIEMLQEVGHGIAMGNAVPELKAVAKKVCGDVMEDGLAKALQEIR